VRTFAWLSAVVLLIALPVTGAAAAESEVGEGLTAQSVPVVVDRAAGGAEESDVNCSGFAPEQMLCTGSFVLTRSFDILIRFSFTYYGTLELRGQTATGSVTVFCDMVFTGPPTPCSYSHEGIFIEGQTFTLTSAATGFGYWEVHAPA